MSISLQVHRIGPGKDALSDKEESEGLTVSFQGEPPTFLSFKSFKMILKMKASSLKEPPKAGAKADIPNGEVVEVVE